MTADGGELSERFAREQAALVELRGRESALETKVAAVGVFLAVIVGFLGCVLVTEWSSQHGDHGRRRGDLGFLVPAAVVGLVARSVSHRLLRSRRETWIAELASAYQIEADALRVPLQDW